MKKAYLSILTFLLFSTAQAQDSTVTDNKYLCEEACYTYGDAIIRHYSAYMDDSLQMDMDNWEKICGLTEPLLSFKVLYAIGKGTFNEDMYGDNIAAWMLLYEENAKGHENMPNVPGDYYAYLSSIAGSLKKLELSPLEKVLADFYAKGDEDVLEEMDSTEVGNTKLYNSYTTYKENQYRTNGRFYLGVLLGAWIPDGNIEALGSHPLIGLQIGNNWEKFSVNLELGLRFLDAPKDIEVYKDGYVYDSRYHSAIYLGAGAGFKYFEYKKHELDMLGGLGYDHITILESTSAEANDGKSLSSLCINAGLAYKFNISKKQYLSLSGRYNMLFYKNRGGTNLNGNAITIGLIYGFH